MYSVYVNLSLVQSIVSLVCYFNLWPYLNIVSMWHRTFHCPKLDIEESCYMVYSGVTRGVGGTFDTAPGLRRGGAPMSTRVVFFVLPSIDVDNSGSRRDVDIHINIDTRFDSHCSGAPGRTTNKQSKQQQKKVKFGGPHWQSQKSTLRHWWYRRIAYARLASAYTVWCQARSWMKRSSIVRSL